MKVLTLLAAKVLNLDSTSQLFQKLCGSRTLAEQESKYRQWGWDIASAILTSRFFEMLSFEVAHLAPTLSPLSWTHPWLAMAQSVPWTQSRWSMYLEDSRLSWEPDWSISLNLSPHSLIPRLLSVSTASVCQPFLLQWSGSHAEEAGWTESIQVLL